MTTYQSASALLAEKKFKEAAAAAGALLEAAPSDLGLWLLTARALLGMGDRDAAIANLKIVAEALAARGKPIPALGVVKELDAIGEETGDILKSIAALYAKDAPNLSDAAAAPPPIPDRAEIAPWPLDADILGRAKNAMAGAWGEALIAEGKDTIRPYLPIFSALSESRFLSLAALLVRCEAAAGETIVAQDSPGDAMYIIAEGVVSVRRHGSDGGETVLAKLGVGAFFGEMALVSNAARAAAVIAEGRVVLLRANKSDIERLAAESPALAKVLVAFCHQRMLLNLMRISKVLQPVPPIKRPDVIAAFTTAYREKGKDIVTEGEPGKGLFLIVSGKVTVEKRKGDPRRVLAELGPGDVFGEISLLMRKPASASVTARENTALLFLAADDFMPLTREFPELLKGAYDIALERELQNTSVLCKVPQAADGAVLI